jgi:Amino acid permease
MLGSGIFNSPGTVMRGTQSVGVSLLFWAAGAIYAITGTYLYVELGLTIPYYKELRAGVPRSGGTLNYLQHAFPWPYYRPNTFLLVTSIFAMAFIILGNMAGNCLVFGIQVLRAADVPVTNAAARGIAVSVATAACFIHAFSRRGGILLGNFLAIIKVLILLMIFITALCALGGVFHSKTWGDENLSLHTSFDGASQDSYGYTSAFLAVIFASTGFEQPNYVSSKHSIQHVTDCSRFLVKLANLTKSFQEVMP